MRDHRRRKNGDHIGRRQQFVWGLVALTLSSISGRVSAAPPIPTPANVQIDHTQNSEADQSGAELWKAFLEIIKTPDGDITRKIVEDAFNTHFLERYTVAKSGNSTQVIHEYTYKKIINATFSAFLDRSDGTMSSYFVLSRNNSDDHQDNSADHGPCIRMDDAKRAASNMSWIEDPTNSGLSTGPHSPKPFLAERYFKDGKNSTDHLHLTFASGQIDIRCLDMMSIGRDDFKSSSKNNVRK